MCGRPYIKFTVLEAVEVDKVELSVLTFNENDIVEHNNKTEES